LYAQALAPGAVERQLTTDWQDNIQPAWSPDGKYLAFVAKVRGGIGIVPVAGGAIRYVTQSGSDPQWSPDGKTLVYRSSPLNTVRERLSWDSTLWIVGIDGSAPRQITRQGTPAGAHNFPRWMPDGRSVIFVARGGGDATSLFTVDLASGTVRPLPVQMDVVHYPAVSADGRYLYFVGAGRAAPLGICRSRLSRDGAGRPQVV